MTEPYYADDAVTLYHGDALEVLRSLDPDSIDAVVTDPPYNLSNSGKRDSDCLRRILCEVQLPHDRHRDAERSESLHLAGTTFSCSPLRRESRAIRVHARVGVPEGAVHLEGTTVAEQKVNGGHVASTLATDSHLAAVADTEAVQDLGDFILTPADSRDTTFCDGTCGCFTEPFPGCVAVLVALPGSPAGDLPGDLLGGGRWGDAHIGSLDDAFSESKGSALVVAGTGAVRRAVLRLDLLRGAGELVPADGADHGNLPFFHLRPLSVGACSGARGLSSPSESGFDGGVHNSAHWTFTLHFPTHGINSSRHTAGFMGKEWDGWESPAAFQRWCLEWAREVFRVLKPGGHLLAFGGTRTVHRLTCAIEDAGFEIRDGIDWIYASGFSKSLDVSKAIDKAAGTEREAIGAGKAGASSLGRVRRVEMGYRDNLTHVTPEAYPITAPATEDAKRWSGWGTALKPAREPIVVARKPLAGTVAQNVLRYGTGALNIDATRVPHASESDLKVSLSKNPGRADRVTSDTYGADRPQQSVNMAGRWPTNLVLSHAGNEVDGDLCADECVPGCPVAELDLQSGNVKAGGSKHGISASGRRGGIMGETVAREEHVDSYGDSGGASRFFPVFRYEPKADSSERPRVNGVAHPTVKPIALMRWLVRLVTPPGGTVLDPFAGSGTTGEACAIEGFRAVLIEREADYLPLIVARLSKPIQPVLDLLGGAS